MTSRPGDAALASLTYARGKTLCNTWRVTRRDGVVLRFTDHDRRLTYEGQVFDPIGMGGASAERRNAGMAAGNTEVWGFIDENTITSADLLADRYAGAKVEHRIVDWRKPWLEFRKSTKWVTQIQDDGERWTATLDGRTHQLQQPIGGRFGGSFRPVCGYRLGDPATCRARFGGGIAIGAHATSGTASTGGYNYLTDTSKTWTPNEWVNQWALCNGGAAENQFRQVLSNTTDTLIVAQHWDEPWPDGTTTYAVGLGASVTVVTSPQVVRFNNAHFPSAFSDDYYREGAAVWVHGDNAGTTSPIVGYRDSTREISLLLPTPFPIAVGDRAIILPGCDGLRQTCHSKFANVLRFGGSPYEPGAQATIDPPSASAS